MARTRTLAQLRADVRYQADIQGFTVRHTDSNLTRLINQSILRFRENVSNDGLTHYLTSVTGTLSSGVTTGYPYKILDLTAASPGVVRIFAVDLETQDSCWVTLRSVDFSERTRYQLFDNNAGQVPEAFANITTYVLALLPAPGYAMDYRVWYLPVFTDLAADSDTFDGVAGWEDWVVWDVSQKTLSRDRYPEAYALCGQERDRCWADVLRASSKVNAAGGTMQRRDTMGRARAARYRSSWRA